MGANAVQEPTLLPESYLLLPQNESRETTVIENWILLCPFEKPVWYLGCGVHKINVNMVGFEVIFDLK